MNPGLAPHVVQLSILRGPILSVVQHAHWLTPQAFQDARHPLLPIEPLHVIISNSNSFIDGFGSTDPTPDAMLILAPDCLFCRRHALSVADLHILRALEGQDASFLDRFARPVRSAGGAKL